MSTIILTASDAVRIKDMFEKWHVVDINESDRITQAAKEGLVEFCESLGIDPDCAHLISTYVNTKSITPSMRLISIDLDEQRKVWDAGERDKAFMRACRVEYVPLHVVV